MLEDRFWLWLRGLLPRGQYSRIESSDTAPGFPDVYYQLQKPPATGTLELKVSRHRVGIPFRNADEGIHLTQFNWIKANQSNHGICWIVARVRGEVFWISSGYVGSINGISYESLRKIATLVMPGERVTTEDLAKVNKLLRGENL